MTPPDLPTILPGHSTILPRPFLSVAGISKSFPGVHALTGVSLHVNEGEVLALIGENGAGKSTLMKIIGGIYQPDAGEIRVREAPVAFRTVHDSLAAGIAIIHQELNLAENLSVAENIYLGRQPRRGPFGLRDRRALVRGSREALAEIGLQVHPLATLGDLSPGQKQLVEIAKALSREARLLVFDEPTSSLSTREAEVLFERIDELKRRGIAIIYISHRLGEITRLAKRVQVLRDGRMAGFLEEAEITHDNMVRLMVGRDISKFFGHERNQKAARNRVVLSVKGLRTSSSTHRVSFELRAGEILGMGGLVGAGRTELVRAIFGVDPIEEGSIEVDGKPTDIRSPRDAIAAGIQLVPEDRKAQGLILDLTLRENVALAGLPTYRRWGLLNRAREREVARAEKERLRIRAPGIEIKAKNLSGGNQQKVVLGKWLSLGAKVLILDEPTRGVDVGAKEEIYALLSRLAAAGLGILMVSSEMEELIAMSDRVIVLHEGRLEGELTGARITEEDVIRLTVGGAA
jgi:ribose transport system ATP-binding protein